MNKLGQDETQIIGQWIERPDGGVESDENHKRIEYLIDNVLRLIATHKEEPRGLYQDPEDGRYWEADYPQYYLHGGGPLRLTLLSVEEAKSIYDLARRQDI